MHPGDLRPPVDLGDLGVAAQAGQEPEHGLGAVAAQVLGHPPEEGTDVGPGVVGDDELLGRPVAVEAGPDQLLLGGPAAVDGRQAHAGPLGHVLHAELVVADVVEDVEHRPEDVLRPLFRQPAATPVRDVVAGRVAGEFLSHDAILTENASSRNIRYR